MLAIAIDVAVAFFLAKFLTKIFAQVPLAIIGGIVSTAIGLFASGLILGSTNVDYAAGLGGFIFNPIITLFGLWYFRRKMSPSPIRRWTCSSCGSACESQASLSSDTCWNCGASQSLIDADVVQVEERSAKVPHLTRRNSVLLVVICTIAIMLLFPPFQITYPNGGVMNMGYGWLFDPPRRGAYVATVNVSMLVIQWLAALIIGGLSIFISTSTKNGDQGA